MQVSRLCAYLLLLLAVSASACVCAVPTSPSEWYAVHHGQSTFVGEAVSVESISDVVRMGGGKPLLDSSGKPIISTVQKVIFHVDEVFEGVRTQTVEVYGSGTTCDFHFTVGKKYLVYGWIGQDSKIRTGKCTRTALLSDAKEDMKFLRSIKNLD